MEGILSSARERDSGISFGLFFSIACNEDIAFIREEDVVTQTQGTFVGDYRVRQQQAACKEWPKGALAPGYREPWNDCLGQRYERLVRSGKVRGLDSSSCDTATPRPPFKTH